MLAPHVVPDDPLQALQGALSPRRVQKVRRTETGTIRVQLQVCISDVKASRCGKLKSVGKVSLEQVLARLFQQGFESVRDKVPRVVQLKTPIRIGSGVQWDRLLIGTKIEGLCLVGF